MSSHSKGNETNINWYKDAIIYELHVKAFADSDQDGIGDLKGLLGKLDYLQELGVTAIWLLPFYPSPLKDDGYDIADYYSINPSYGQLEDFKELLDEAHNRGLKIITELVLNHTSDRHPWFQRARKAPVDSDERNFYVWSDDPTKYADVRIIFQDFETSNWTWDPEAKQYFWHRFFSHQPDLNYDNPRVQEEVFKILDYWCSLGVDGFRLDAIPYLFERENTNGENLPETHAFLRKLRKHIDTNYPGTLLLAEANMWPEDSAAYFGNGDECHMNYHFPLMPRMYMAMQMEDRYPILDIFDQTPPIPETCQWAIFLRNHDELTLEMVTDEERDYMYKVYAKDPKAKINLGIRQRLAPLMNNNRKKIELLNTLLFSLPGTPVLYYGDEIGMGDNFYLGDRDGVRTPMQWTPGRNAGFSEANPHKLYLPVIQDMDYHYESLNVEIQSRNPSSLLWWMKRIIAKRKQYKAFAWGDIKIITSENSKIFAFTRSFEDQTMLIVVNLSRYAQPALLELAAYAGQTPVEVFSKNRFPIINGDQEYFLSLSAHDCQWYLLESKQDSLESARQLKTIAAKDWDSVLQKSNREKLEHSILPDFLADRPWFDDKNRVVESIAITRHLVIPEKKTSTVFLLIEVSFKSGLPQLYQLPIAYATEKDIGQIKETNPQAIIARLKIKDIDGYLYDAFYGTPTLSMLLGKMLNKSSIPQTNKEEVVFSGKNTVRKNGTKLKSRIITAENGDFTVAYGSRYVLKLFRKLDFATNSDAEISRFLTYESKFEHMPAFIGTMEWKTPNATIVLGLMKEMIESSSDGWTYILDRLDELNEKILASPDALKLVEGLSPQHEYEDGIHPDLRDLFSGAVIEQIRLLGFRTAELHKALAIRKDIPAFAPENYSLHYQRSLFAGFQSLIREAFHGQRENVKRLDPDVRHEFELLRSNQQELQNVLKEIYQHKIDVVKIRIHGDYHLGQLLFTGKDFVITNFEGEPTRSYSERRLKRSPLRDVAAMIRSLHYAAYANLINEEHFPSEDFNKLMPVMEAWHRYVSRTFLNAYVEEAVGTAFVPETQDELDILMTTFQLEKALNELKHELAYRPDWVIIPLNGIKSIMENFKA